MTVARQRPSLYRSVPFALVDAEDMEFRRAVRRWDEERCGNPTRYFAELMSRPSVARVVDEAR